jgi:ABC-2 type transport system permease protein
VLAGNAEGFLQALVAASGGVLVGRERGAPVTVVTRALFNPRLDGRPFMVAGVFGFVLSFLTTLITAVTIVNERLTGTLDQLQVTPATALEIVLGKLLPLAAVFSFDVLLMMLVAGVVLEVWPHGSAVFFLVVSSGYVVMSLALGLVISASSRTAAEAVQKTVIFSIPLVQLSGFVFPIRSMPAVLQWLTQLFPATHYIELTRAVYVRGAHPLSLVPELLWLAAFGALLAWLAVRTVEARG